MIFVVCALASSSLKATKGWLAYLKGSGQCPVENAQWCSAQTRAALLLASSSDDFDHCRSNRRRESSLGKLCRRQFANVWELPWTLFLYSRRFGQETDDWHSFESWEMCLKVVLFHSCQHLHLSSYKCNIFRRVNKFTSEKIWRKQLPILFLRSVKYLI